MKEEIVLAELIFILIKTIQYYALLYGCWLMSDVVVGT